MVAKSSCEFAASWRIGDGKPRRDWHSCILPRGHEGAHLLEVEGHELQVAERARVAPGRKRSRAVDEAVSLVRAKGSSLRAAARRFGVTEGAVRYRLRTLAPSSATPFQARAASDLSELVHGAVLDLEREHNYGGVVPLPALRARLADRAPDASRADVDAALFGLERAYRVDLLVAQSPASLGEEDRAQGIARPGRGYLFYVAAR